MSIKLQLKDANFDRATEEHVKLQYMPATIDENIKTNVDTFFNNYTEEVNGVMKNALRGYPLDGCKFDVPSHYQGVVFQEIQKPLNEDATRTFKVNGIFSNFTYWNYDKEPSNNDQLRQALIWNDFANILHTPITAAEFEMESTETANGKN